MGNQDAIDSMLADMRNHVSSLHSKMFVADAAFNRCQTVNNKIVVMKEYQDKVSTMNSCWRSKNRKGLVANLQHENRQMLALEEENRRLRFAFKEMEDGLQLIMSDYRRVISGFQRSNSLLDFARQHIDKNPERCIDNEKFMVLAAIVDQCVSIADERIIEQAGIIAELRTENATLRELAYFRPKLRPFISTGAATSTVDSVGGSTTDDRNFGDAPTAGDGKTTDSAATTPVKTQQTPASGRKGAVDRAQGRGSQIPVNGGKNQSNIKKVPSTESAATTGGQYSWPVHVNREPSKVAKESGAGAKRFTDNNGRGGRTSPASVTKAPLPRDNPARRGVISHDRPRRVTVSQEKSVDASTAPSTSSPTSATSGAQPKTESHEWDVFSNDDDETDDSDECRLSDDTADSNDRDKLLPNVTDEPLPANEPPTTDSPNASQSD